MNNKKVKIHLKQQIDEAIEKAEQRFLIQQRDIGLYKTSVHMLESADMEFSNHLASIHYEYKRLFDLIDPDVQKIIFDEDDDNV